MLISIWNQRNDSKLNDVLQKISILNQDIGKFMSSNPVSEKIIIINCNTKKGISKDKCLSDLAFRSNKFVRCDAIDNTLIKDTCYLNYAIENIVVGKSKDNCNSIDDPYIKYLCLRLVFWPHVNFFITRKERDRKLELNKENDKCVLYDDEHYLRCVFSEAADLAKNNLSKSKEICNGLNDVRYKSECEYYIAIAQVISIQKETDKKIRLMNSICENISYTPWKSECYYNLADELIFFDNENFAKEIVMLCKKSNEAKDYACFDHGMKIMGNGTLKKYCELLDNSTLKINCYSVLGRTLIQQLDIELKEMSEICNEMVNEIESTEDELIYRYSNSCLFGMAKKIGFIMAKEKNLDFEVCENLQNQYKGECYAEMIKKRVKLNSKHPSEIIKQCEEFPIEYREMCSNRIIDITTFAFLYNIDYAIKVCNNLNIKYKEKCFVQLSDQVKFNFDFDNKGKNKRCKKLPIKYQKDCE
jgi:hypothetical protein